MSPLLVCFAGQVNEGGGVLLKSLLELDQDEQSMFVYRVCKYATCVTHL
jgi:hypothetical protein